MLPFDVGAEMVEKAGRDAAGYLVGLVLFVVLVPVIMWMVSGTIEFGTAELIACILCAGVGLSLSVWSIVYMRNVGKGNPMDAFNHELAPRTRVLMTDGPYGVCRNPMLLGILIYYVGMLILLGSLRAILVFVAYGLIMAVQVAREEARLRRDFGREYDRYCRRTKRLIPFVW